MDPTKAREFAEIQDTIKGLTDELAHAESSGSFNRKTVPGFWNRIVAAFAALGEAIVTGTFDRQEQFYIKLNNQVTNLNKIIADPGINPGAGPGFRQDIRIRKEFQTALSQITDMVVGADKVRQKGGEDRSVPLKTSTSQRIVEVMKNLNVAISSNSQILQEDFDHLSEEMLESPVKRERSASFYGELPKAKVRDEEIPFGPQPAKSRRRHSLGDIRIKEKAPVVRASPIPRLPSPPASAATADLSGRITRESVPSSSPHAEPLKPASSTSGASPPGGASLAVEPKESIPHVSASATSSSAPPVHPAPPTAPKPEVSATSAVSQPPPRPVSGVIPSGASQFLKEPISPDLQIRKEIIFFQLLTDVKKLGNLIKMSSQAASAKELTDYVESLTEGNAIDKDLIQVTSLLERFVKANCPVEGFPDINNGLKNVVQGRSSLQQLHHISGSSEPVTRPSPPPSPRPPFPPLPSVDVVRSIPKLVKAASQESSRTLKAGEPALEPPKMEEPLVVQSVPKDPFQLPMIVSEDELEALIDTAQALTLKMKLKMNELGSAIKRDEREDMDSLIEEVERLTIDNARENNILVLVHELQAFTNRHPDPIYGSIKERGTTLAQLNKALNKIHGTEVVMTEEPVAFELPPQPPPPAPEPQGILSGLRSWWSGAGTPPPPPPA